MLADFTGEIDYRNSYHYLVASKLRFVEKTRTNFIIPENQNYTKIQPFYNFLILFFIHDFLIFFSS